MKSRRQLRADATAIWTAALRAVDPESAIRACVKRNGGRLDVKGRGYDLNAYRNVWVLGAGKAAAPMGRAMENILGRFLSGGFLVTKYGHGLPLKKLKVMEAGHPLPDAKSLEAAEEMISLARGRIQPEDLVVCVFSGGASSLLVSPASGVTLQDKTACTQLLLNGGADIFELNAVRKHLSAIKGGGLARMMAPAESVCLLLSDVVGDDLGTIASGPMTPDLSTFGDCIEILEKLRILERVPRSVRKRFELGAAGSIPETPKEHDPAFRKAGTWVVANNARACAAAAAAARRRGYRALILTSRLDGDTGNAAGFHMSVAEEIVLQGRPLRRPACLLSGGETTVRVAGKGKGGRNQEFALHCIRRLARLPAPCVVASLGTDGTDGPTDAAGAIADNATLSRSIKFGAQFLKESAENNDSYRFFEKLSDLVMTGPTRTNVMDLHIVLVG
jgi:hydroxypyruvate reductase